jgi:HIP---CoA ligase
MVDRPPGDQLWPTIGRMLRDVAAERGDALAVVEPGGERLSYRELRARTDHAARALMASGVERGDRVAIWGPNSAVWIVVAMAAATIGAAIVPLNTRFKSDEAAQIFDATQPRVVFTVTGFLDIDFVSMCAQAAPWAETVVMHGRVREDATGLAAFLARADSISPAELDERLTSTTGDDVSDIMFTSGTTGRPKGVPISHAQDLKAFREEAYHLELSAADVVLGTNPLFHAFGYKVCALGALMTGAAYVAIDRVDPPAVLAAMEREAVTFMAGPPTMFLALMEDPAFAHTDLSRVCKAVCGSTAVPAALFARIRAAFGLELVAAGYGQTESSGVATFFPAGATDDDLASSSGPPMRDIELRIVEIGSDRTAPEGGTGEILVRGYPVMRGYLDLPDATHEVVDDEGWLHTGDVGRLDERGYLVVTDRLNDMFVSGGFNVYPAEVDRVVETCPGVAQAAVVGAPDDRFGEVSFAFVIREPGAAVEANDVLDWTAARIANYKAPRGVAFVDAFPLTANGKVRRADLAARAAELRRVDSPLPQEGRR